MNNQKLIEKLESNEVINDISDIIKEIPGYKPKIEFVGGCVIDIIEGRKPKDYDLSTGSTTKIINSNFDYCHETKTAITYKFKKKHIVQFLKNPISGFEYKISQSKLTVLLDSSKALVKSLDIDEISFSKKQLIPTNFTDLKVIANCLLRIPHWKNKGYHIEDETYLSLLRSYFNLSSCKS